MKINEAITETTDSMDLYRDIANRTGRAIRQNKRRLSIKSGKDYAELLFFGDWHYGYPTCMIDKIQANIDYCIDKNVYVLLMGDLMEAGTRGSIGDSVFRQTMAPQDQLDRIVDMLEPLAKKKLILGSYRGNHENRVWKDTGIDPMRVICNMLKVPYLGGAMWNLFYVGDHSYKIYGLHGVSGSKLLWTKLKAVADIAQTVAPNADVLAHGHLHENTVIERNVMDISAKYRTIVESKHFLVLTGHYLGYDNSYAQERGMGLGRVGSPKLKLFGNKSDIHASQ